MASYGCDAQGFIVWPRPRFEVAGNRFEVLPSKHLQSRLFQQGDVLVLDEKHLGVALRYIFFAEFGHSFDHPEVGSPMAWGRGLASRDHIISNKSPDFMVHLITESPRKTMVEWWFFMVILWNQIKHCHHEISIVFLSCWRRNRCTKGQQRLKAAAILCKMNQIYSNW